MSANRPSFANSLVAMYGSSPETSDVDSDAAPEDNTDLPPNESEKSCEDSAVTSDMLVPAEDETQPTTISENLLTSSVEEVSKDVPQPANVSFESETVNASSEPKTVNASTEPETVNDSYEPETMNACSEPETANVSSEPENVHGLVSEQSPQNSTDGALPASDLDAPESPPVSEEKVPSPAEPTLDTELNCATENTKGTVPNADSAEQNIEPETLHSPPINSVIVDVKVKSSLGVEMRILQDFDEKSAVKDTADGLSAPLNDSEPFEAAAQHSSETSAAIAAASDCSDDSSDYGSAIDDSKPQPAEELISQTDAPMEQILKDDCEPDSFPDDTDQNLPEKVPSPKKPSTPAGRRLRQVRNPSVKAAEAAADAAFVAAVTPTRKNLKEAKLANVLSKSNDTAEASGKKSSRLRRGRSSSHERISDSRTSPVVFAGKEDSYRSDKMNLDLTVEEGKLSSISEEFSTGSEGMETSQIITPVETEKPIGIKMKISRESAQILDPSVSKLEVQIPSESVPSEVSSPGGTKRLRKWREGTVSPVPPLSPITLKIAKRQEGLEVISSDISSHGAVPSDSEGKVEKITLKLSREDRATIVKSGLDESVENRPEKLTIKLVKDEASNKFLATHSQDDAEEIKPGKITLKLSKGELVKKKETESLPSASDTDGGKVERITLKLSTDNNVSIVRPKDILSQTERVASPEPGKIEKITLKVSKNDEVSIIKPSSPVPSGAGIEKLTLKVSKDGTAAVASRQHDETLRDSEGSKVEKITFKFSKDEGVSIVKPASPVPERKSHKVAKDEPLSPLSPLIISRCEDGEPQKERITLKLSKAGGHPSPVGVIDERSSWSIKSNDSDNIPSPVLADTATSKSRPKRAITDIPEVIPSSAKRLKLSQVEKRDENDLIATSEAHNLDTQEVADLIEEEKMDISSSTETELETDFESISGQLKAFNEAAIEDPLALPPGQREPMEVILIDSEESQGAHSSVAESSEQGIPLIDVEDVKPANRYSRRKPRGRPRKAVLTPGSIHATTLSDSGAEDTPQVQTLVQTPPQTPKAKREKSRPEPVESDRPKRSCKGREKPPPKPKPVKATKPRGRAALAKQKAEQSMQPEKPQLFEEETRMSADCGSNSETPIASLVGSSSNGMVPKVVVSRLSSGYPSATTTPIETPVDSPGPVVSNEESQASQGSVSLISSTTESTPNRGNRKGRMEINVDPDAQAELTVEGIAEYTWPLNDGPVETYMIQEQLSSYLGVKSFKRKYPNMQRRAVDHDERQYLLERKLVSEGLCDLGLTALPSHEVLDVLCTDFPEKFEEYRRFTRERVQREFSNKQKAMLASGTLGKEDSKSKAIRNMASFNALLNRSRRDQRRCCFDLQSFTVHYPEQRRRQMTAPNVSGVGAYPIALVPGQYTDFFKEYTSAELRYFPLNTVLYGPLLPHELMKAGSDGSQSESSDSSSSDSSSSDSDSSGSDSDSDSDSSSESGDDSLSQSGPGTVETQEVDDRPDAICRVCSGDRLKNKLGRPESLIHCASCEKSGHLSCLDLTMDMMPHIRKYSWHCTDCKLCAQCNDTADEDKMLFCDMCDRGYHIYCVGLRKVPEGRWHCKECALCASCGARDPGGTEDHQSSQTPSSQDNTPTKTDSQWQHEFKKGDKGTRVYVRTLCVPCSKLWRKGRYCRLCWKCFTNQPEEEGLINCSICDRWMHADCCRKAGRVIDVDKVSSYICELCQQQGVRASGNKSPLKVLR